MEYTNGTNEKLFFPGSKVSFKVLQDLSLNKTDATLLNLISSTVLYGLLTEVNLFNASILSTKLEATAFNSCNLTSSDICSVWANKCSFNNTDFSHATISDCTFIDCTFNNCTFNCVSLLNSHFIGCTFEQLPIDDSTVALNHFIRCEIHNTHLTESFTYQIFEDCIFVNVEMREELLGFNFGFSKDCFLEFTKDSDLSQIELELIGRGSFINAAILHINQTRDNYDSAIIVCVKAIGEMMQRDILLKAEEIQFIKNIVIYLYERRLIAPISLILIWRELYSLLQIEKDNISKQKALPHIREFSNALYFSIQKFREELQETLELPSNNENSAAVAEMKIVYKKAPEEFLLEYMERICARIGNGCPAPRLIRTEVGSYIEFFEIANAAIPYLQTLFGLLGVIAPFIVYYKQKKDHEEELASNMKSINEKLQQSKPYSMIPVQQPKSYTQELVPAFSPQINVIIINTINIMVDSKLSEKKAFSGYNSDNIQSITIIKHSGDGY